MTRHRRHRNVALVGSVVLTVFTVVGVLHRLYPYAVVVGVGALVLTEAGLRADRAHRRELAEHRWARQHGAGEQPGPLSPCCLLAQRCGDRAHSSTCTRDTTLEQFDEIVARLEGP